MLTPVFRRANSPEILTSLTRGTDDKKHPYKECCDRRSMSRRIRRFAQDQFHLGSNCTGKTTISRVIDDASPYSDCEVTWHGASPVETLVYNRDLIDRYFNRSDELKGIFAFGEKDKGIADKIAVAQKELALIKHDVEKLTITLEGLEQGKENA